MTDLWTYRAKLERVVDGDTVYLQVDLGMRVHTTVSIRIMDVDTPELYRGSPEEREAGRVAREDTIRWFSGASEVEPSEDVWSGYEEWPVIVRTERDKTSFNRYVGRIYNAAGESLTDYLYSLGYE